MGSNYRIALFVYDVNRQVQSWFQLDIEGRITVNLNVTMILWSGPSAHGL